MEILLNSIVNNDNKYKNAFILSLLTITFALAEALFSTYYGFNDESLTLFGFGVGSFIEVVSAIGVAHMIVRIKNNEKSNRDNFERTALRITGTGFYILLAGLIITVAHNIWIGHNPATTISGVVISLFSIALMLLLYFGKKKVGNQLNSDAILADAACTKVCIYTSIILLTASVIYEITKLNFIDDIGTLGIAYFSFKEGKECFEKTKSNKHCSCC
ncbi:MAG: cation transporter [Chitinophagaceae bacterium]|nr:cation transporter [Chitinophagaceae bacterium]